MSSIPEQYNQLQVAILQAKKELEKLDTPNTTLEQLQTFEEKLRTIMTQMKEITAKVKTDRSDQKQIWQR